MADTLGSTPNDRSIFHDVGQLMAQAAGIFRAQALAVVTVASAVVIGPTVLVAFLEDWVEHHDETAGNITIAVAVAVAAAVLGTLGGTFLAGLLDRMAGHHVHGHPFEGLAHTFKTLPYGRLLVADFLVSFVVLTSSAIFVLPGLVLYTLLALVGPLVIIEELDVRSAIRRSVALVRTNFWLVFIAVTTVTVAEIAVEETLEHLGLADDLAGEIAVTFLVGVLAGSWAALIKVCATYELIAREIERETSSPRTR